LAIRRSAAMTIAVRISAADDTSASTLRALFAGQEAQVLRAVDCGEGGERRLAARLAHHYNHVG